jgi:hypothetical protein
LLAVTAFAIGFPIWYRWPYDEVEWYDPYTGGPATGTERSRSVTTWQRTWGGGRVKLAESNHSPEGEIRERRYRADGVSDDFRFYQKGKLIQYGSNRNNKREGLWVSKHFEPDFDTTMSYQEGVLHGSFKTRGRDGSSFCLEFDNGIPSAINGRPIESPLIARLRRQEIPSPELLKDLQDQVGGDLQVSGIRIADLPSLKLIPRHPPEGVYSRHSLHVPVVIDPQVPDPNLFAVPTASVSGGLCAWLIVLTQPYGLDCDYRFGCLWITTAEDARAWRDRTGVSQVRLSDGSALAAAWDMPVTISVTGQPLPEALQKIAQNLAIAIDVSAIASPPNGQSSYLVTLELTDDPAKQKLKPHPFHDVLGILLDRTHCRCMLEGETLVILPPEEQP